MVYNVYLDNRLLSYYLHSLHKYKQMKYIIALLVALVTFSTGNVVRAEDSGSVPPIPPNGVRPTVQAILLEGRAKADALRNEIEAKKGELKDMRQGIASTTQTLRGEIKDKIGEVRAFASTTRGEIKDSREEMRRNASTTRAEIRADVKEKAYKRLVETASTTQSHLYKAIDRLNEIKTKIDSRITKFADSGVDVTLARADLITANFKIDQAKASVGLLSGIVISTDDPRDSLVSLKDAVKTAQKAINDAHQALVNVVKNFKPAVGTSTTTEDRTENNQQ